MRLFPCIGVLRILTVQLVLTCSSLLLASCSNSQSGATEADESLQEYAWLLESYGNDEQAQTDAANSVNVTFKFNETSDRFITGFSGYDGCNIFGANVVSSEPGHLQVVDGVNQDGAFCEELQRADYLIQYDYFYSVFDDFSFEFNRDDRLRLRTLDAQLLVFKKCGLAAEQALDQDCLL